MDVTILVPSRLPHSVALRPAFALLPCLYSFPLRIPRIPTNTEKHSDKVCTRPGSRRKLPDAPRTASSVPTSSRIVHVCGILHILYGHLTPPPGFPARICVGLPHQRGAAWHGILAYALPQAYYTTGADPVPEMSLE